MPPVFDINVFLYDGDYSTGGKEYESIEFSASQIRGLIAVHSNIHLRLPQLCSNKKQELANSPMAEYSLSIHCTEGDAFWCSMTD